MQRGYAEYSPLTARRPRHPRLFRTAHLNAVGWAALVGACVLAGVLAALVGAWAGLGSWLGAPAAFIPLAIAHIVDRRRWSHLARRR